MKWNLRVTVFLLVLALTLAAFPNAPASAAATESPFGTVFQDVSPIYNVAPDKAFTIKLKLGKEPFDAWSIEDYFGVYGDREATQSLYANVKYDPKNNTITIKPSTSIKGPYSRNGVDSTSKNTWGGLQKYYLIINHDVNAKKVTKLKTPKRIMFTVSSPAEIPNITAKLNPDGNYKLQWDAVKGASKYKVYAGTRLLGVDLEAETTKPEFVLTQEEYAGAVMNTLVNGSEFAVTAVVGGKESRLSNIINTEELKETAINGLDINQKRFYSTDDAETIFDLPRTATVYTQKFVQGVGRVTKQLPVVWDFRHPIDSTEESYFTSYDYAGRVLGTAFVLEATFYTKPTEAEIAEFEKGSTNIGAQDVEDKIKIDSVPDGPADTSTKPSDITQSAQTKPPAKPQPAGGLEKAIADGMLARNTTINLSAFPEAGDSDVLKDTLMKVIVQYPYILDEQEFGYDYKKKSLIVKYSSESKATITQMQNELKAKVKSVVGSIITKGMSAEQKEQAIHDWLIQNGTYQDAVLDAYESGTSLNDIAEEFPNAFNAYGILVDGIGVCQSYAEAFKLLADETGLPAVVMTGKLGNVPHAWNMVQLDGAWYHVDVTNNDGEDAVPYATYNTNDAFMASNYSFDNDFALDKDLPKFASTKTTYDYYAKLGQMANNKSELRDMIKKGFESNATFYIKVTPNMTNEEVYNDLKDVYENSDISGSIRYGRMFNVLVVLIE